MLGDIRVDGLELSVVASLVVVVGLASKTTIAAVVAVVETSAGDELLLREGEEFTRLDLVGTFKRASGGEGPA